MLESRIHEKFPEDSANRDYDVFEELPDGSTVWRASVFGMENAELKLRELTEETGNKLFALHLQDRSLSVIHPLRRVRNQKLRRVS